MISKKPIIGVLMPGDMGHGIAKVLVENNFKVLTFLKGRSKRTLKLANEARVINIDNFVPLITVAATVFTFFSVVILTFGDFSRYVKNEKELNKGNLSLILNLVIFSFFS